MGDGYGLEELVGLVLPAFGSDRSLARWVAVRGGIAFLSAQYIEPSDGPEGWMHLLRTMGIDLAEDASGDLTPRPNPATGIDPSSEVGMGIVGLFVSLDQRLTAYPDLEPMSLDAMAASDLCSISEAISVDYIVWSVVALLRDGFAENLLGLPEPSALGQTGWYVEPVFAKSERYWDGDWTTRCRLPGAREEISVAI